MKNIAKGLFKIIIAILLLVVVFSISYLSRNLDEDTKIKTYLKLAILSINTEYLSCVNKDIKSNQNAEIIINNIYYQRLVTQLNTLTNAFPLQARWSYITDNIIDDSEDLKLAVLTIPYDSKDITTHPGFRMNTSDYPIFKNIIKGTTDIQVSNIVYDNDYKEWTKTGAIKIFHQGNFIGVLAIDLTVQYLISSILEHIFATIIINAVLWLVILLIVTKKEKK